MSELFWRHKTFLKLHVSFPANDDDSSIGNEDDSSTQEISGDFSSAISTNVDSDTGVVTRKEAK